MRSGRGSGGIGLAKRPSPGGCSKVDRDSTDPTIAVRRRGSQTPERRAPGPGVPAVRLRDL